jgi:peptidyl-prolyl cis-trans isomerase A (cyclophilin A)
LKTLISLLAALAALNLSGAAWAQKVKLATSAGDIVVELDREKAPKTVDNFVQYVKAGHYDGTVFHRVIDNFMIQGGGYKPDMSEKPTRAADPAGKPNGLSNVRGTLAMARTMCRIRPPRSSSSTWRQPVPGPANSRDGNGYAVFGKVVEGMDVVDKIKAVPTQPGMHQNVPVKPVILRKATLEK